ncbi:hypothetical protein VY88_05825 [Azospirillum thiophilum]|nr:helix-turn-helix transcriptional regulator [Azospirillum thiophilum]KJR65649.1 hypothetical protein VY88_05825 [Azospirillum thiophilum]
MNRLSERLKLIRIHLKETQKSMSRRFNLGENTWQTYELYGKPPKGETLAVLAELGFDINWLLTGRGDVMVTEERARASVPAIDDRLICEAVEFVEQWLIASGKEAHFKAQLKGKLVVALCRLAVEEAGTGRPELNPAAARQLIWFACQTSALDG